MKSSTLIPVLIITIGIFGYFVLSSPKLERENPPSSSNDMPASSADPSAKSDSGKNVADFSMKLRAIIAEGGSFSSKVTPAHIDAFLAKNGRTPANLATAWEVTGDKQWLEKALAAFPDSPVVLVLALSEKKDPRRADWIARFKNADTNNPLPWLFSSELFAEAGKVAEARAELAEALKRPAFYVYFNERMRAAESLFAQVGTPAELSIIPAMFGQKMHHLSTVQSVQKAIIAAMPNDPAVGAEIRSLGKMLQTPEAGRFILSQLVGISIENKGLATLSEAEQKTQTDILTARKDEIKSASDALMKSLTDEKTVALLPDYIRRLKTDGELAALRWLRDQPRK